MLNTYIGLDSRVHGSRDVPLHLKMLWQTDYTESLTLSP